MSLTKLSRATRIPVSTIFDKLKDYENKNLIMKHTTLLDFKMLGFDVRIQMLITADKSSREDLQKFLVSNPKVNTVFRINNGFDFLVEAIFKDIYELDLFSRDLDEHNVTEKKEFFIMEEIKREEFLSYRPNIGILR